MSTEKHAFSPDKVRPLKGRIAALVCRKCLGKQRKGKGAAKRIAKSLRESTGEKRLRLCEVPCLGVCPKGGVTLVLAGEIDGGQARFRVVPGSGYEHTIADLLARSAPAAG